jgi:hypothetical protein
LNAPNSNIKKDLKRLEEEQIFSELDFKITDKEIIEGIFSFHVRPRQHALRVYLL